MQQQQQEELDALQSIYGSDFSLRKPTTVWKGASALTEFDIRLKHAEPALEQRVAITLHARLPKTYPDKAVPTFTIQNAVGLSPAHISQLSDLVKAEALRNTGRAMVFDIASFCQEWILTHNTASKPTPNVSLATQMTNRTIEEERKRARQAEEEAEQRQQEEARRAADFAQQVAEQQLRDERARQQQQRRKRGHSFSTDATGLDGGEMVTFDHEIEVGPVKFDSVRLCCRQKELLCTTHFAEPAYYNHLISMPPLELYTVSFDNQYYTTQQGRKKTREVLEDLKKLVSLRSKYLLQLYAVDLRHATSESPSKLLILAEQRPPTSLFDILQAAGSLRPEKACDYLAQILSALNVLHSEEMVHRGLCAKCIHVVQTLGTGQKGPSGGAIKLSRASYTTRLLDLHKSNPFAGAAGVEDELRIPASWMPREVANSPLTYSRARDLWNVGIVLLQMLYGLDVMDRYDGFRTVLALPDFPPEFRTVTMGMFEPSKKSPWSCLRLLEQLQGVSFAPATVTASVPIAIPTPRGNPTTRFMGTSSSPETEMGSSPTTYFGRAPAPARASAPSRYQAEFDELEHLGSGGFGQVVKARHKLDGKIYAVKKIKLRSGDTDARIFREVNTLSRLNHRYIVRYYATWLEDIDDADAEDTATDSDDMSGWEQTNNHNNFQVGGRHDLDLSFSQSHSKSRSRTTSFPYVVFGNEDDAGSSDAGGDEYDEDDDADEEGGSESPVVHRAPTIDAQSRRPRQMLYISMEFVEKETLKERVEDGLEEEESWRLFHQVLEALVHMSSLGIIHRDIKLSNVFIDAKGDAKVGDFGLATSSIADVAPSDMPAGVVTDPEMTKDVGTRLYVAPEVLSGRRTRNQAKADMYSLGICFFEMNYKFSTGAERIHVLEELRKPQIVFPDNWPAGRERQRKIIAALLQHDPDRRPSALELSQSELLPPRVADEFFNETLRVMTRPDSTHYLQVVKALFHQQYNPIKASTYNSEKERLDLMALSGVVVEHLKNIFTKHGAVEIEPPLLGPAMSSLEEYETRDNPPATFLDRNGDLVTLPKNLLVPFARMAVRREMARIKRFHIGDTFMQMGIGHPDRLKVASFDIITPDVDQGPLAAAAEALAVANECLDTFPGLSDAYKFYISHSTLTCAALEKVPAQLRNNVCDILSQAKSSFPQKRAILLRLGLSRGVVDSLEQWSELPDLAALTEGWNPAPQDEKVVGALREIEQTIKYAHALGVKQRQILVKSITTRPSMYDTGIHFEVAKGTKRSDKIAAGGRYEHLFSRVQPGKSLPSVRAVGLQISVNAISAALDHYQRAERQKLQRSRTSFGYWSPRRTDVYVISREAGQLEERLEVVSMLWAHNISADVMYDSALDSADPDQEPIAVARREGILFCVILPSARSSKREFRVRNVLSDKEHEVSRQNLPTWLAGEIATQRKADLTTAGVSVVSTDITSPSLHFQRDPAAIPIEVLLPYEGEGRKSTKWTRHTYQAKVEQLDAEIRSAVASGIPLLAIDVDPALFNALTMSNKWLFDDEAWRAIMAQFPQKHTDYAWKIRDTLAGHELESTKMAMLLCLKDFRVFIFKLPPRT
ncbi:kinase-like protein [Auricularia subglabra TFB-10046 SS5]|uniref:non-specific serine/threonine protein kinase n=1 Tax=Auricularia subglabra (strain TFB-10046 / SS5) TaxID=717982 RepID=J0WQN1_AURST|nr:kinase-like protein [Auricularia subglabra TFB-10046 SS5]